MQPIGLFLILWIGASALINVSSPAWAHHVLGRPAYSLNENSNTPPTIQLEVQIGLYLVTVTAFPAFPKVAEESRMQLYATRLDNGDPFLGEVTFFVRNDRWWDNSKELLGKQHSMDGIYRQAMVFSEEGDYLVTAHFDAQGEPYDIDLPIRIGNPVGYLPLLLTMAVIGIILLVLAIKKRRIQKNRVQRIVRVTEKRPPSH